jgi:PleD family two-component response regulator
MAEPLALVLYPKILPGTQLVNRLQDLRYRVQSVTHKDDLSALAEQLKPMLLIVDLDFEREATAGMVTRLRQNPATNHIAIIGVTDQEGLVRTVQPADSGPNLIVTESAILNHLPQCLERALEI